MYHLLVSLSLLALSWMPQTNTYTMDTFCNANIHCISMILNAILLFAFGDYPGAAW